MLRDWTLGVVNKKQRRHLLPLFFLLCISSLFFLLLLWDETDFDPCAVQCGGGSRVSPIIRSRTCSSSKTSVGVYSRPKAALYSWVTRGGKAKSKQQPCSIAPLGCCCIPFLEGVHIECRPSNPSCAKPSTVCNPRRRGEQPKPCGTRARYAKRSRFRIKAILLAQTR